MRVGFLNNQIDNRGTGNALYDYAHYNEEILGNESLIFVLRQGNFDEAMGAKLSRRFTNIYTTWDLVTRNFELDVLYHIKSGENDPSSLDIPNTRYAIHAVFNASNPHGDRYATISRWMGERYKVPYVPHIVRLGYPTANIRKQFDIPHDAYVYGRHGGSNTFDIPWVWDSINQSLEIDKNLYYLFMNTDVPSVRFYDDRRVVFLPQTADDNLKASFIYACDAMIHARYRGETFGISVGEFAIANKPVVTFADSPERAHLDLLGGKAVIYHDEIDLLEILLTKYRAFGDTGYQECTPENVMRKFKEVFLD
jgi:hypothetical protein